MSLSNIAAVAETPAFAKRVMVAATMLGLPYSKEMVLYVAVQCREEIAEPEEGGEIDGSTIADASILAALEATVAGAAGDPEGEPEVEGEPEEEAPPPEPEEHDEH